MPRYIDADALTRRFKRRGCFNKEAFGVAAATIIATAPTVDAVEVVRCCECIRFEPHEEIEGETWTGYCKYGEFYTDEYDFCSRGERRNDV